jgi:ribosomal protein S18 acetylase RimI-like enzyme
MTMTLYWHTARDAQTVHALVEESDRAAALRTGTPAPHRRTAATRHLVEQGSVRLGTVDGFPVATVTVGAMPSFDADAGRLPYSRTPWYMQRLAVRPGFPDPFLGLRAIRHAIERATAAGADALRAEANPDLSDVLALLTTLGFVRHATMDTAPRRTWLQLPIPRGTGPAGGPR